MAYRERITAAQLRERLDYNPETGVFTRLERPLSDFASLRACRAWNARWAGKHAGTLTAGYIHINIDRTIYQAHRLAWLHFYGAWPSGDLDHRDTDGTHNAIDNLRPATPGENSANASLHRDNASGYKGVTWDRDRRRWRAQITFRYKLIYLGLFDTPEAAHAAYCRAATELFGQFARGG